MAESPPHIHTPARRFELHRHEDATGVSGTGIVASGLCWPDGRAALRWHTNLRSTTAYESMADVEAIHGHDGRTRIVWVDGEGDYTWSCVFCGGGTTQDWCADCGAHGTASLVPLWWSDDMERRRHVIWDSGVRAAIRRAQEAGASGEVIAVLERMRELHNAQDLARVDQCKQYRQRVSATDARPVIWRRP